MFSPLGGNAKVVFRNELFVLETGRVRTSLGGGEGSLLQQRKEENGKRVD